MSGQESDCLFQLNVLLWALTPVAPGIAWVPVLQLAGFELSALEQPLPAGPTERLLIRKCTTDIAPNPTVDLVARDGEGRTLLVECKATSFSATSNNARQARGLLVAATSTNARFGLVGTTGVVSFTVPASDVDLMFACLQILNDEVVASGFPTASYGAIGIELTPTSIRLKCASDSRDPLTPALGAGPEVLTFRHGNDPRPLYLVPWIPGAVDPADHEEFREKIRQHVMIWLGRSSVGDQQRLYYEALCLAASNDLFSRWRDRSSMKGNVYSAVARICTELFGAAAGVHVTPSSLTVDIKDANARDQLLDRVRKKDFPVAMPAAVQPELPFE